MNCAHSEEYKELMSSFNDNKLFENFTDLDFFLFINDLFRFNIEKEEDLKEIINKTFLELTDYNYYFDIGEIENKSNQQ